MEAKALCVKRDIRNLKTDSTKPTEIPVAFYVVGFHNYVNVSIIPAKYF